MENCSGHIRKTTTECTSVFVVGVVLPLDPDMLVQSLMDANNYRVVYQNNEHFSGLK